MSEPTETGRPAVGDTLTRLHRMQLMNGRCAVCLAADEYDFDHDEWGCFACGATFRVTMGLGKSIRSAVRVADLEDDGSQ